MSALRGEPIDYDLSVYDESLAEVRAAATAWTARSDEQLRAAAFDATRTGSAGERLTLVFSLVCEAARRTIGLQLYDE